MAIFESMTQMDPVTIRNSIQVVRLRVETGNPRRGDLRGKRKPRDAMQVLCTEEVPFKKADVTLVELDYWMQHQVCRPAELK